ncbi:MAG: peptide chain release factor N(5)-glutamine methyltransferase [Solirubrobacterales bacterium]
MDPAGAGGSSARRVSGGASARDALGAATDALSAVGVDTPRIDAEVLLAGVTGRSAADLIADREARISPSESRGFSEAVRRRLRREPVAYILGRKGFRHIELEVDRRVLVPRPETEMLVEFALLEDPHSVLELGTGSGAVALAIADEIPGCEVTAGDVSTDSLEVASLNADRLGLAGRVHFFEGTWPASGSFGLIVANLPYVALDDELPPDVRDWEPPGALFPGVTGLECFEEVLSSLPDSGIEAPVIALEIGHGQGEQVSALVRGAGFGETMIHPDLAGLERMVTGRRKAASS